MAITNRIVTILGPLAEINSKYRPVSRILIRATFLDVIVGITLDVRHIRKYVWALV